MIHKILISGYYGFNNIGDESILLALTRSLREKFGDTIELAVLSSNPVATEEKFGVRAMNRKSFSAVWKAVHQCDLLISGGGSLLQDATSNRSILYYLGVMEMALLQHKKVFIYSQGIGPINLKRNRKRVRDVLSRVHGIVVRDKTSKELLVSIGIPEEKIDVACDPVIGMNAVSLEIGKRILEESGFRSEGKKPIIGFAIRERNVKSEFVTELEKAIQCLIHEKNAAIVLIPFFHAEDEEVMEELARRVGEENVTLIRRKCLTEETMSLIGNMDLLVGVRLHSLIYAAIMGVPSVGISYDPKINAFMNSIGRKALSATLDFRAEYLVEEVETLLKNQEEVRKKTADCLETLRSGLSINETRIEEIFREMK